MRGPRLTYANVVSTICLFLVLGGAAWAATKLPKNSVGTPQLKKNAVTGAKVKNGSLTGADINASTLGKVPQATSAESATNASHATSADTAGHANTAASADQATRADTATRAGDASTLDGQPASAFLPTGRLVRIRYETDWGSEAPGLRTVLAYGPLTLSANCVESESGGHTLFQLFATGPAGSTIDYSQLLGTTSKVGVASLEPSTTTEVDKFTSETEPLRSFLTLVYRDSTQTISMPIGIYVGSPDDLCRVTGSAIAAGQPEQLP